MKYSGLNSQSKVATKSRLLCPFKNLDLEALEIISNIASFPCSRYLAITAFFRFSVIALTGDNPLQFPLKNFTTSSTNIFSGTISVSPNGRHKSSSLCFSFGFCLFNGASLGSSLGCNVGCNVGCDLGVKI